MPSEHLKIYAQRVLNDVKTGRIDRTNLEVHLLAMLEVAFDKPIPETRRTSFDTFARDEAFVFAQLAQSPELPDADILVERIGTFVAGLSRGQ